MALLKWGKKYSVGVKAMDDQHITLIKILNELHAAMLRGKAQSVADPILKKMTDYVSRHFSDEERLMENSKFPQLAEHCAKHLELAEKVAKYVASYEQGDQTIYPELLRFVGDWLHDHMLIVDKQYTVWLNELGVR
jgi:hemerythrin-like metal-binding protein